MTPKLRIAAITDEFSPDLETALNAMSAIGMTGAELRVIGGKNIMDLTEDELKRSKDLLGCKRVRGDCHCLTAAEVQPSGGTRRHPFPAGYLRV
jgi:hypothetical protein